MWESTYIRLWLLCVAATPFILYCGQLLSLCLCLLGLSALNYFGNPISSFSQNNSLGRLSIKCNYILYLP